MLYEAKQLYLVRTGSSFLSEKTSWLSTCKPKRYETDFMLRKCNIFHEVKGVTVSLYKVKVQYSRPMTLQRANFCLNPYLLHAHLFKKSGLDEMVNLSLCLLKQDVTLSPKKSRAFV